MAALEADRDLVLDHNPNGTGDARHGLGIVRDVLEQTDDALHLWPATLYSALVEEKGARSLSEREIGRVSREVDRLEADKVKLISEIAAWVERTRTLEQSLHAEREATANAAVENASLAAALEESHTASRLAYAEVALERERA